MEGFTLSGTHAPYTQHGPIGDAIRANLKDNIGSGIMMIVGLTVANKAVTKLGVSRAFNKTVRSVGMGDLVKM